MSDSSKKNMLKRMLYIYYPLQFYHKNIWTQLYSQNEVNAMSLYYTQKLSFKISKTRIRAQKIHNFTLQTFEMIISEF